MGNSANSSGRFAPDREPPESPWLTSRKDACPGRTRNERTESRTPETRTGFAVTREFRYQYAYAPSKSGCLEALPRFRQQTRADLLRRAGRCGWQLPLEGAMGLPDLPRHADARDHLGETLQRRRPDI